MASTRDIRRRIKSVGNTQKITRAMEMVSAAKMRKSVASVLAIRPYAHAAWSVLTNLSRAFEEYQTGLLEVREVKNVLAIAITSNKGLCGAFNAQIAKKIKEEIAHPEKLKINRIGRKKIESTVREIKIDFITIGKKGESVVRKAGKDIVASFNELTYLPKIDGVRAISKIVTDDYLAKKYDKVVVFYTDYISAMNQQTKVRQLLPLSKIDLEKQIAEMDVLAKEYGLEEPIREYKIEPTPASVLEYIFPRLIEMQIYHAILESNASKESSRMMAMRGATDAAGEMRDDLTFVYNQIRQMKITQEIAEISAGRTALES
ncbi:MAG: ATP synthase F1 subunit gamma [Candidatus Moranbacteria bacterium CG23_combo_of_CG06-09_8_20_14_all_39_10]|nr:MAG: ATP synthase F1 subunit gamma [Candidatus Moranbacteria bacterium CG23_combo_of_CG06-09_8_20_14_all_39_10]